MSIETLNLLVFLTAAGVLLWRGIIAVRVALDARQRGFATGEVVRWTVIAVVVEDRYWWGARLDRMSVPEARELLVDLTRTHDVLNILSLRCPLCETEIKNALAVSDDGELYVRRNAACANCDFRVDACRHCSHFLPASASYAMFDRRGDFSHGRCSFYRSVESVRTAYPQHASRMEALGYDMLPTPKRISDSYIPLSECTAFTLKPDLLRQSGVPWIDRQRVNLIRLHQRVNRR
jgi:hypothetical protein